MYVTEIDMNMDGAIFVHLASYNFQDIYLFMFIYTF